jgi:hypothetical protein
LQSLKLKIGDFGISKQVEHSRQLNRTIAGTMTYMAPEVISGEPYSATCDVYSLGIIFGQVILGMPSEKYAMAVLLVAQGVKNKIGNAAVEQLNQVLENQGHATVLLATKSGQIAKFIIDNANEPSTGALLQRMLSEKDKRPAAAELLEDPLMHAWIDLIEKDRTGSVTRRQETMFGIKNRGRKVLSCIGAVSRVEKLSVIAHAIQMVMELMSETNSTTYNAVEIMCGQSFLDGGGPSALVRFMRKIMQTQKPEVAAGMWYMCLGLLLTLFGHARAGSTEEAVEVAIRKIQRSLQASDVVSLVTEMASPRFHLGVMWARVYRLIIHLSHNNPSNQYVFATDALIKRMLADTLDDDNVHRPEVLKTSAGRALLALMPSMNMNAFDTVFAITAGSVLAEQMRQMEPRTRRDMSVKTVKKLSRYVSTHPEEMLRVVDCMYPYLYDTNHVISVSRRKAQCTSSGLDGHLDPCQWYCVCKTCSQTGVCLQCAHVCHESHEVELRFSFAGFSCRCGSQCLCATPRTGILPQLVDARSPRFESPAMDANNLPPSDGIDISRRTPTMLTYSSKKGNNVCVVTSANPIGQLGNNCGNRTYGGSTIAYCEVRILDGGILDGVYVGVAAGNKYSNNVYPGTEGNSIAFHCDDGLVIYSTANKKAAKRQYAGPCGTNNVIGVGVTDNGLVYFVRDGHILPLVPDFCFPYDCSNAFVHLIVGLRGRKTIVEVTNGRQVSFSFDAPSDVNINQDAINTAKEVNLGGLLDKITGTDVARRTLQALQGQKPIVQAPIMQPQGEQLLFFEELPPPMVPISAPLPDISALSLDSLAFDAFVPPTFEKEEPPAPIAPQQNITGSQSNTEVDKTTILLLAQQVEALQRQLATLQQKQT